MKEYIWFLQVQHIGSILRQVLGAYVICAARALTSSLGLIDSWPEKMQNNRFFALSLTFREKGLKTAKTKMQQLDI
jgi:hypothetical protein